MSRGAVPVPSGSSSNQRTAFDSLFDSFHRRQISAAPWASTNGCSRAASASGKPARRARPAFPAPPARLRSAGATGGRDALRPRWPSPVSGRIGASKPTSRSKSTAAARLACVSMRRISSAIRSTLTTPICGGHRFDRLARRDVEREPERGRKPHGSQQPQLVFLEPCPRLADGPHDAAAQVVDAADEVDHAIFQRIVEQAVDREVAAVGVGLGRAELDRVGMPAVAVRRRPGETWPLRPVRPACGPTTRDHAKLHADGHGSPPCQTLRGSRRAGPRWPRRSPSADGPAVDRARSRRPNRLQTRARAASARRRRQSRAVWRDRESATGSLANKNSAGQRPIIERRPLRSISARAGRAKQLAPASGGHRVADELHGALISARMRPRRIGKLVARAQEVQRRGWPAASCRMRSVARA